MTGHGKQRVCHCVHSNLADIACFSNTNSVHSYCLALAGGWLSASVAFYNHHKNFKVMEIEINIPYVLIGVVLLVILAIIFSGREEEDCELTYNAHFGDEDDYLSSWNHGFALTGDKAITKALSHSNCFLSGPTSSGKSSVVIQNSIMSLARGRSSQIIFDVALELWKNTSQLLVDKGYDVRRLDFADAAHSETFNPLLRCKSQTDIQKLALIVLRNALGETKADPFWENSSIMLISLMARFLVYHKPPEYRTMQNVLRLVENLATGNAVDKVFVRCNDPKLLDAYKATIAMGEKPLQSVIATCRTALQLFSDPEVCKTTATNSFDFDLLRGERPVALYVCLSLQNLQYFRPLSALFFHSLFHYVMSRLPEKHERSVFFLLDEFATMRFPDMALTVSNIRKFNAGMLLCMQDEQSLIAQYGVAESHQIKTNCGCQVYLKGQPLHTCKELSQVFGRYSLLDENENERGSRELMTPDEIRMCDDALILIQNKPPLRCTPVAFHEKYWWRSLTKSRPVALETKVVSDPPLLPLD